MVWNTFRSIRDSLRLSTLSVGSSFVLYLPATKSAVFNKAEQLGDAELKETIEHILVVDDDENIRTMATKFLKTLAIRFLLSPTVKKLSSFCKRARSITLVGYADERGSMVTRLISRSRLFVLTESVDCQCFSESIEVKKAQKLVLELISKSPIPCRNSVLHQKGIAALGF